MISQQPAVSEQAMAPSATLTAAKKGLRTLMKQTLLAIPAESVEVQSATVYQCIINLKSYQDAQRIGIYLSMPTGEVQTDKIVDHALKSGKKVFVPFLYKNPSPSPGTPHSVMDMVSLLSLSDYQSLARDKWGIPNIEPGTIGQRERILGETATANGKLDMVLVPGVAFQSDEKSNLVRRLGHGMGFYDFFIHRYGQRWKPYTKQPPCSSDFSLLMYGLALKEQLLDLKDGLGIPINEHDQLLQGLIVGDGNMLTAEKNDQEKS